MARMRWLILFQSILTSTTFGSAGREDPPPAFSGFGAFRSRRIGRPLLVALGRERRWVAVGENHEVHAPRQRPVRADDVGFERGPGVGARREVEGLAARVEHRIARIAEAVGELRALPVLERVEEDRAEVVLEPLRVRQPLAVRGPRRRPAAGRLPVAILVDANWLLLVDVDVPGREVRIDVGDLLAVGRPPGRRVEGWLVIEPDLPRRLHAQRVADVQLVFAALLGEVGNPLSVRRPRRIALHYPRRCGEVSRVALLGRHGEDVAASLEQGSRPGRRDVRVGEPASDVDETRAQLRHVARQLDGHR